MGKNVPLRKCLGCDEMLGKKGLLRIVRDKDGNVSLDLTGKKSGRGAYICPDLNCLQAARKAKRLERALECAIPAEVYDAMEGEIRTGAAE